jgi:hypothetical protein
MWGYRNPGTFRLSIRKLAQRLWPLLFLPHLSGQALQLTSASASPGDTVTLEISFHSSPGKEASALQWETAIPSDKLAFVSDTIALDERVQKAGKSIQCVAQIAKAPNVRTLTCVLFGGRDSIPESAIATLALKIRRDATPDKAQVRLDHAAAVTKDLKRLPLEPAEATVTIAH